MSVLSVKDFSCRRRGKGLFHDVSFELFPGEILHIQGPNGSGKTSFLKGMSGLLSLAKGSVKWGSHGLTPQDFHWQGTLWSMKDNLSLENNLLLWNYLEKPITRNPRDVLGFLGLQNVSSLLFKNLSQGQKKLLSLSRLWLHPKPLWFLDEPLTYLDAWALEKLMKLFKQHQDQGGIVCFSHHGRVPAFCSSAYVLDLAESSPFKRIFKP